jgi:hypothetical protein
MTSHVSTSAVAKWFTVEEAAVFLNTNPNALRARLRRGARRASDGGVEANFDGMRGKKLGVSWRVAFSSRWLEELAGKSPRGQ